MEDQTSVETVATQVTDFKMTARTYYTLALEKAKYVSHVSFYLTLTWTNHC